MLAPLAQRESGHPKKMMALAGQADSSKMFRLAGSVPMRVRKVRYPHKVCAATLQTLSGCHAFILCLVAALLQAMQADVEATFHVYPPPQYPRTF